jgi:hypothetical protein
MNRADSRRNANVRSDNLAYLTEIDSMWLDLSAFCHLLRLTLPVILLWGQLS